MKGVTPSTPPGKPVYDRCYCRRVELTFCVANRRPKSLNIFNYRPYSMDKRQAAEKCTDLGLLVQVCIIYSRSCNPDVQIICDLMVFL